jgi:hypothetical protein
VVFGAFFVINLTLAVISEQFTSRLARNMQVRERLHYHTRPRNMQVRTVLARERHPRDTRVAHPAPSWRLHARLTRGCCVHPRLSAFAFGLAVATGRCVPARVRVPPGAEGGARGGDRGGGQRR